MLTQFKSDSLIKHLMSGWNLNRMLGQYIDPVPAQMRTGKNWYMGTADAVFQNFNLIEDENPDYIAVFGADHIYKMDISQMLDFHRNVGAVATGPPFQSQWRRPWPSASSKSTKRPDDRL